MEWLLGVSFGRIGMIFRTSMAAELGVYDAITTLFDPNSNANFSNPALWILSRENNMNITYLIETMDHQKENMLFQWEIEFERF